MRLRTAALALVILACGLQPAAAQERFKRADSRRPYAHHVELYDARDRVVDPTDEAALPYSPASTCRRCHDYAAISSGHHFNAASGAGAERPGEPWILADPRTGTQLPLSYRGWPGTYTPSDVGLDAHRFTQTFGRQLPGGSVTYTGAAADQGRWLLSGALEVDCMMCHAASRAYSQERWAKEVAAENYAWAPAAALGLARSSGEVKTLPNDQDPAEREKLPTTVYDLSAFADDGTVFFDIVRLPRDAACYACHTVNAVGPGATPRWARDGDVHLRAGLSCADCHRNGIDHDMVRGFEGESHPSGIPVRTLSCRGCHLDETDGHGNVVARGGRLGAPKARHVGLPPLHLEKLSCTACHSGPRPSPVAGAVQTAMAHGLGIPSQTRTDDDLPLIVQPVLRRDAAGVIQPQRMMWPSFWGWRSGEKVAPMAPDLAYQTIRRALRIRKDLRAELGKAASGDAAREEAFRAGIAKALAAFAKTRDDATPVFVAAGRIYCLAAEGETLVVTEDPVAAPCAWPLAHDVRPAREATGATGCVECHAAGAPFLHGTASARGPVPEVAPLTTTMAERTDQDPQLISAWEQAFGARDGFKWVGFVVLGAVALILLMWILVGGSGFLKLLGRGRRGRSSQDTPDPPAAES